MNKKFKKFIITATAIGAGITGYMAWRKQRGEQIENKSDGNDYDEDLFDVDGEMISNRNYVNLSSTTDNESDSKDVFIDDNPENDVNFDSLGSAEPQFKSESPKAETEEVNEVKEDSQTTKDTNDKKEEQENPSEDFLEDEISDDLNK